MVGKKKTEMTIPPGCGSILPSSKEKKVVVKKQEPEVKKVVKQCPDGKVLNPTTNRCVKAKTASKECPEGKIRNPTTGRCVKVVAKK